MRRKTTCGALLLACLVWLAVSSEPASAGEMFEHATEHYLVRTDVSPEMAALVGNHMETIFREYANRFAEYGQVRERFNVSVFATEAAYKAAVPREIWGSTGAFTNRGNLLAAHCDGRTTEEVLRTLYHEGFHQFMYVAISRDCPIWLNEGIAEYFSEATWNGQSFTLGEVPTIRLYVVKKALRERGYVPFAQLFALDPGEWLQDVRTDAKRAAIFYSEAWSIVHFLIHAENGRYVEMLNSYLKALSSGRDPKRAFAATFGTNLSAFEYAWANYVLALEPSPKFTCRDNMESILLLAQLAYPDVREFSAVADLRRLVYTRQQYRWEITRPTGEKLLSSDRQAVAALFKCPLDAGRDPASYLVVRVPGSNMPMLVCDHHSGIIVKAYFQQESAARPHVVVEEQVRETVSRDLQLAMQQAYVAQFR